MLIENELKNRYYIKRQIYTKISIVLNEIKNTI
jgi:hypothetical protein